MKWLYLAMVLMTIGTVYSVWNIISMSSMTAQITSTQENPLYFSVEFSDVEIQSSYGEISENFTAVINNLDGNMTLRATFVETIVDDTTDDCEIDIDGDCILTYYHQEYVYPYTYVELSNNDTIEMADEKQLRIALNCKPLSCEQNISTTVQLELV